ncbi:unnamed protein product [Miscanthus lutarioriparius]|uniref:Uncharacterized protein n=1 Tax=Miscanthus lutarioriparius TaxID=422564 RepID=A0A811S9I8_9POAL|nr:unnamed protein product [Miscanthus lutarioriparius]
MEAIASQFNIDTTTLSLCRSGVAEFILSGIEEATVARMANNNGMPASSTTLRLHCRRWSRQAHASAATLQSLVDVELRGVLAHTWEVSTVENLLNPYGWVEKIHPATRLREDYSVFRCSAWCFRPEWIPSARELHVVEPSSTVAEIPPVKRTLVYPISGRWEYTTSRAGQQRLPSSRSHGRVGAAASGAQHEAVDIEVCETTRGDAAPHPRPSDLVIIDDPAVQETTAPPKVSSKPQDVQTGSFTFDSNLSVKEVLLASPQGMLAQAMGSGNPHEDVPSVVSLTLVHFEMTETPAPSSDRSVEAHISAFIAMGEASVAAATADVPLQAADPTFAVEMTLSVEDHLGPVELGPPVPFEAVIPALVIDDTENSTDQLCNSAPAADLIGLVELTPPAQVEAIAPRSTTEVEPPEHPSSSITWLPADEVLPTEPTIGTEHLEPGLPLLVYSLDDPELRPRQYHSRRPQQLHLLTKYPSCCSMCFPPQGHRSLATEISDHCPLVLGLTEGIHGKRRFHFESFWTKLPGFHDAVAASWSEPISATCAIERVSLKLNASPVLSNLGVNDKLAISKLNTHWPVKFSTDWRLPRINGN